MIPVGSAIPEGVGVGMDKENDLLWMRRKRSRNCQKQMSNMPSVLILDSKLRITVSLTIP